LNLVDVAVEQGPDCEELLGTSCYGLLAALGIDNAELSVVLTDDAGIQALNRQWRGKDTATDVLSFPQMDGEAPPGMPLLLGDIVISHETATKQAREHGHPLEDEVRVLLVHGLLHLLGHNHLEEEEAQVMRTAERKLIGTLWPTLRSGLIERVLDRK
jgi:probable rRNA maturation factor